MRPLKLFSVVMMSVIIVASLQMMPACATYGFSLLFYYLIGSLLFFIPSLLITAELTTTTPLTGGSYIWVEKAFGRKWGFFASSIQWLANLIWYPTIFSFIATALAYLIAPELAANKLYLFSSMLLFFWGITLANCFGIRISSLITSLCAVSGIILPTLILIIFGFIWIFSSHPLATSFNLASFYPNVPKTDELAFLTQVIISFIGLEMAFVHAGDIEKPYKTIPRALSLSAGLILAIVIAAPLSIAMVIPIEKINILAGLLDAFKIFFSYFSLPAAFYLTLIALIFIGNCGNVAGWMISSTRAMQVASSNCSMPAFMQKKNRFGAPVGILVLEAIVFSCCSVFFLFFETISNAYWILLILASEIGLLYYLLIFAAAVKIKKTSPLPESAFKISKGISGTLIAAILASIAIIVSVIFGFFSPNQGSVTKSGSYSLFLAGGIAVALIIPLILLQLSKKSLSKL